MEQIEKFDDPRSSDDEEEEKKFGGLDGELTLTHFNKLVVKVPITMLLGIVQIGVTSIR